MGGGGLTPPGTPLQQLLDDGLLGPRLLGPLLGTVADALADLHASGRAHGDVTAHTVWLTDDLEPRLSEPRTGTARPPDDVLALGLLLARGLTGDGSATAESLRAELGDAPGPPHLREACRVALDPDAEARPTATALASLLRADTPLRETPPRATWKVGDRVGPYELIRHEGADGPFVGQTADGLEHVVKLLPPPDRPRQAQRFAREAGALAKLAAHPNLVALRAFERLPDGQAYLALDRVDGDDLAHTVREGPLAVERALRIGAEVASALTHAHLHGVVHRDLTPHHVVLRAEDDRALLTGFGLAFDEDAPRLTQSREILGTLGYQAPEQAQGAPVGPPADVFGLGVVLYEALTGQRPFAGESFLDLLEALLRTAPLPPSHHRPDLPPAVDRLVLRALQKDPVLRPTAAELARDLPILAAGDRPRPEPTLVRPAQPAWAALGLLLVLLLGLAVHRHLSLRAWEREAEQATAQAESALSDWRRASLPLHLGPAPLPDLSPLHHARAHLERLSTRTEAARSAQGPRLSELRARLDSALALARVDTSLAWGETRAARAQLDHVPAGPERTVRLAVFTARQGALDALLRLSDGLKRSSQARTRVHLLAARLALQRGSIDRAGAILSAAPPAQPPLDSARQRLLARVSDLLGQAALEAGDGAQAATHLAKALELDPAGEPALLSAWIGRLTRPTADAVLASDLLHALQERLPSVDLPAQSAAIELALTRQLFASATLDLPRLFRTLERALALDARLDIPPAVIAECARRARRLTPGQRSEGLRALILVVRCGRAIDASDERLARLWGSKELTHPPSDPVVRYVRAAALTAWLRTRPVAEPERRRLAAQVDAGLAASLEGDHLRGAAREDAQRRRADRGWLSR